VEAGSFWIRQIFDGRIVDRRYHEDYHATFSPPIDGASSVPVVEALAGWWR